MRGLSCHVFFPLYFNTLCNERLFDANKVVTVLIFSTFIGIKPADFSVFTL